MHDYKLTRTEKRNDDANILSFLGQDEKSHKESAQRKVDVNKIARNIISELEERRKILKLEETVKMKTNAAILLESSKICPFKWSKNMYVCLFCDEGYCDPADLRKHYTLNHNVLLSEQIRHALITLKKFELLKVDITDSGCKFCEENIPDFEKLKCHLVAVHNKGLDLTYSDGILPFRLTKTNFNCALCEEKYEEYKTLNHHMNVHFKNFICEQCGAGFITPERLRRHTSSHETGSFSCEICNKVFRSLLSKNQHYANVHVQVKRHRCPQCPETFRNYFQRSKHVSSIHGLKLKEFKCNMCPKVFTVSGKLGVHVRSVHLKEKRHACDMCEWKFYSKSELKDHMVKHSGERNYQCRVCKKSYARKYTLNEHMRIHENDRRFVCGNCGRGFIQKCSLKHHLKVHHPVMSAGKISDSILS